MWLIVVSFVLGPLGHGDIIVNPPYRTRAECEAARPQVAENVERVLAMQYGPASITSRCASAAELKGGPGQNV